jgi:hypothetical protein
MFGKRMLEIIFACKRKRVMSRDSSVGITTGYGLDGRGSIPGSG